MIASGKIIGGLRARPLPQHALDLAVPRQLSKAHYLWRGELYLCASQYISSATFGSNPDAFRSFVLIVHGILIGRMRRHEKPSIEALTAHHGRYRRDPT